MPQMHLRKPLDLHILLVDHLQKKKRKKRIQTFKQTEDSR